MRGRVAGSFADRFSKFPIGTGPSQGGISSFDVPSSDAVPPPDQSNSPVEVGSLPVWLFPSSRWELIDLIGYSLLPVIGSTVTILSFRIPVGRHGIINKVANNFVGGGWVEGTGDVIWQILVDGGPPPNANSYNSIPASLGSPANPVYIPGFRVFENQLLTMVALNNPAGPNGGVVVAGQRVGGRLIGYLYPREQEPDDTWV